MFTDIIVEKSYTTSRKELYERFFLPALNEASFYKRSLGVFSSKTLIEMSRGINNLIKNKGKVQYIVSPNLNKDDFLAIRRGYEIKEIVSRAIDREFVEPKNEFEEERLNWLAHLIADDKMEIKVAFIKPNYSESLFQEKIGVMYDDDGNEIAFKGVAIEEDYEGYQSVYIFRSWIEQDQERERDIESDFDYLWDNLDEKIDVIDFPVAAKARILTYKKPEISEVVDVYNDEEEVEIGNNIPRIPRTVELHDYQKDAINEWSNNDYVGIFDMATGTGKTYTGLGAITRLYEDRNRVAVFIVCPYQHLVEQWVEDIIKFNIEPIIAYSDSIQHDWKKRLEDAVFGFKHRFTDFFCIVTTNSTFSSKYVIEQVEKLGKDTLLVVDEAHNFGAYNLSKTLNPNIQYRLALSATLERAGDELGTMTLINYFGTKCIEYGLARAIKEDKLTPYYYYPKVVYLSPDELEQYNDLSYKLAKCCYKDKNGKSKITKDGEKIAIKRARIVAGAIEKISLLKDLMVKYKDDSHILIYCGATRIYDPTKDVSERDEEGERQIVAVSKMLGNELGMKVTHFTSNESASEREIIKKSFAERNPYQAIVAIKCLDEGVNIPSIKTAIIMASSTNPKEYIQRRGRVLRKYPGKDYAVIYDFITLPRELHSVDGTDGTFAGEKSLVKKEISRMLEFGQISRNPEDTDKLVQELKDTYGLNDYVMEEEEDGQ